MLQNLSVNGKICSEHYSERYSEYYYEHYSNLFR